MDTRHFPTPQPHSQPPLPHKSHRRLLPRGTLQLHHPALFGPHKQNLRIPTPRDDPRPTRYLNPRPLQPRLPRLSILLETHARRASNGEELARVIPRDVGDGAALVRDGADLRVLGRLAEVPDADFAARRRRGGEPDAVFREGERGDGPGGGEGGGAAGEKLVDFYTPCGAADGEEMPVWVKGAAGEFCGSGLDLGWGRGGMP